MKIRFLIGLLCLLFFNLSCKTTYRQEPCDVIVLNISHHIQVALKKGKIGPNPLLIKDNVVLNNFLHMDSMVLKSLNRPIHRFVTIPSKSKIFVELYGPRANDGVIFIKPFQDFTNFESEYSRYVVNGNEFTRRQFKKVTKQQAYKLDYAITGIQLDKGEIFDVFAIQTIAKMP